MWLITGGHQRIVFVEPHGMLHAPSYELDEKARLHERLPKLASSIGGGVGRHTKLTSIRTSCRPLPTTSCGERMGTESGPEMTSPRSTFSSRTTKDDMSGRCWLAVVQYEEEAVDGIATRADRLLGPPDPGETGGDAEAAGLAERAGEIGLAGSGRAGDEDGLTVSDPLPRGEAQDEGAVETAGRLEVEVLDRSVEVELGKSLEALVAVLGRVSLLAFEEWGRILGDEVMAAALLDRLLHRCHIVNIRGNSYLPDAPPRRALESDPSRRETNKY